MRTCGGKWTQSRRSSMAMVTLAEVRRLRRLADRRTAPTSPILERLKADPSNVLRLAGLEPDAWQATAIRSTAQRTLLLCGRQTGKSTTCAGVSLAEALTKPARVVLLVSPSLRQSGELYKRVADLYDRLGRPVAATAETATQIQFCNGSRIVSLPGSPDTIRGFSPSLVVVDEAALIDDGVLVAVRPMLAATQGRLILATTPAGRRGAFHAEWTGTGDWERTSVKASECPRIPADFLREERKGLGERWYSAEYENEFLDLVGCLFAPGEIDRALMTDVPPLFEVEP